MVKRLFAGLLAVALLVGQTAAAPSARVPILSGIQNWALQGSLVDAYLSRNGGSCTAVRKLVPCTSILSVSRAQTNPTYGRWADGHFSTFSANTLRLTDLGLLREQTASNLALWSNDFTNAVYTAVNVTAAMDQTGPDNVANSASSITASANGATILQTVTGASSQRDLSIWLKRITGSGTVTLTQNGTTGTACTLSTTAWTQCSILATVLNPSIGLIFGTSGDKIAGWDLQLEAQAAGLTQPTSPMPTTTVAVTRNFDNITLVGPAATALQSPSGWSLIQIYQAGVGGQRPRFIAQGSNALMGGTLNNGATGTATDVSGANGITATLGTGNYSTGVGKFVLTWDSGNRSYVANNGTVATGATPLGVVTSNLSFGGGSTSGVDVSGYVQRFAYGNVRISDLAAKALSQ